MDLLESLREDNRAFAVALLRLDELFPEGRPIAPLAAQEAKDLLSAFQPRFWRHEELEHKFLFPELRGLNTGFDFVIDRDEVERAEIEREMKECQRLLASSAARADLVDEIEVESFPASDPPPWTLGRVRSEPIKTDLTRKIHRFVVMLRNHFRLQDAVIYPSADQRLPGELREQMSERAEAEEFPDFIDMGAGD